MNTCDAKITIAIDNVFFYVYRLCVCLLKTAVTAGRRMEGGWEELRRKGGGGGGGRRSVGSEPGAAGTRSHTKT